MHKLWSVFTTLCAVTVLAAPPEFEPNLGQAPFNYRYIARSNFGIEDSVLESRNVRLSFVNTIGAVQWTAAGPTGNVSYYCNLPDRSLCSTPVPSYRSLTRHNLYPGIDWVIYSRSEHLEYDLRVHPNHDHSQIRLRIDGAPAIFDAHDGTLRAGNLLHWRPEAYQWIDGRKVAVNAALTPAAPNEFTFTLGPYRRDLELVIDPVVEVTDIVGGADDDVLLGATGNLACGLRWGLTRSYSWSKLSGDRARDVFVQATSSAGANTVFWGGSGDEDILGYNVDSNCHLALAGSTASHDVPLISRGYGPTRTYSGGDSDGFILLFRSEILFATTLGGPGADRINAVRYQSRGASSGFAFAGQTTDSNWPAASVRQIGPGGNTDAVVGFFAQGAVDFTVIGGSGDDAAIRFRPDDENDSFVIAGETTSPDFPGVSRAASSRDIWITRTTLDFTAAPSFKLFGGSGDDCLAGLAVQPGLAIFIAGATASPDLPASASSFAGGPSDGFIARLDPFTHEPLSVSYFGGDGRDEFTTLAIGAGDLYLGGFTDSTFLPFAPGDVSFGGVDGLFVLADARTTPIRAIRLGGDADDRVYTVEPGDLGKATVAGASGSTAWLTGDDPFTRPAGLSDGFVAALAFAASRAYVEAPALPSTPRAYLGHNLRAAVAVVAVAEQGMDGVALVYSSDPSKLRVSDAIDQPGVDRLLIGNVDRGPSFASNVFVEALADTGEVDLIIEGRAAAGATFPSRRLTFTLAPSAAFFTALTPLNVPVNSDFSVEVIYAPVLPDGRPGPPQALRHGFENSLSAGVSDSSALKPSANPFPSPGPKLSLYATREGVFTVAPVSFPIPSAPGQSRIVRAGAPEPTLFTESTQALAKDHIARFDIPGQPGDEVVLTSLDPSLFLLLPSPNSEAVDSLTLRHAGTTLSFWIVALRDSGTAAVRGHGTYFGRTIDQRLRLRAVGYTAILYAPPTLAVGARFFTRVETRPVLPSGESLQTLTATLRNSPIAIQSSDSRVLELESRNGENHNFIARQIGSSILTVAGGDNVKLRMLSAVVEVVPVTIDLRLTEIVVPLGMAVRLFPSGNETNALKRVRVRLSEGAPFTLEWLTLRGSDITFDASFNNGFVLTSSAAAAVGQRATLFISGPGVAESSYPIRIVEAILVPSLTERRVAAGERYDEPLMFELRAYDDGRVTPTPAMPSSDRPLRVSLTATPPGICTFEDASVSTAVLRVPFTCPNAGETVVKIDALPGFAAVQRDLDVRIVSRAAPAARPIPIPSRVLVGYGLQAEASAFLTVQNETEWFFGSLTSSDPERVRLSLDPKAPGQTTITISDRGRTFYVHGYDSEGVVYIEARSADGRTGRIPVHLFASTLAVRPASTSDPRVTQRSVQHALSDRDLTVDVIPHLVDSASAKLLWFPNLSLRGGTDPAFVRALTSDSAVAEPVRDGLITESGRSASLGFRVKSTGDVVLTATQPQGFVDVPDSALRVRVFERMLRIPFPVILSPDLQTNVWVEAAGGEITSVITVTSLNPDKLLLSRSASDPGSVSVTISRSEALYIQALSSAIPGEKLRVRLEAAGYVSSETEIEIRPAALRSSSVTLAPGGAVAGFIVYSYRPVDARTGGLIGSGVYRIRPGISIPLRVSSADPAIAEVVAPEVQLDSDTRVALRGLRPGRTTIRLEAPPYIDNGAAETEAIVFPFTLGLDETVPGARYLVSHFTVGNSRTDPTTVSIASVGQTAVFLGTAASGPGAPSSGPLVIPVGANQRRTIFYEPTAAGSFAEIKITAPDFQDRSASLSLSEPNIAFLPAGAISVQLASTTATLSLVLTDTYARELPLGSLLGGPLKIQLQSSNSAIVRAPAAPVEIAPGETRKTFTLALTGRGDAVVSFISPPGFNGATARRDILITVR